MSYFTPTTDKCLNGTLDSWDGRYTATKIAGIEKIVSMTVSKLNSPAACTKDISFGFYEDVAWVDDGCRAKFFICYGGK